jgi:hypothetical protein
MTEKLSDLVWHLEFYQGGSPNGTRTLVDKRTHLAPSVEQAIDKAKSVMQENSFPLGKANVCLMKRQDGTLVREVFA